MNSDLEFQKSAGEKVIPVVMEAQVVYTQVKSVLLVNTKEQAVVRNVKIILLEEPFPVCVKRGIVLRAKIRYSFNRNPITEITPSQSIWSYPILIILTITY